MTQKNVTGNDFRIGRDLLFASRSFDSGFRAYV